MRMSITSNYMGMNQYLNTTVIILGQYYTNFNMKFVNRAAFKIPTGETVKPFWILIVIESHNITGMQVFWKNITVDL